MSRIIEPRPNRPPSEPPIITGMLFDTLADFTGTGVGIVEDVGTKFPTVESGTFPSCTPIARLRENESSVTTSRYAHAGTAVNELI